MTQLPIENKNPKWENVPIKRKKKEGGVVRKLQCVY